MLASIIRPMGWLLLIVAIIGLALLSTQPPSPLGTDAPADRFSAARAMETLDYLVGDGTPRPVGSAANAEGRKRIISAFDELGLEAEEVTSTTCRSFPWGSYARCAEVTNIIVTLSEGEGPAVMLMAHHDSVPAGPGAADDMHAVAIILEVTRILQAEGPYRNRVIALITDGEEAGLLGAQAYFENQRPMGNVGAIVNMEARGNAGVSYLFETIGTGGPLIEAYAKAAPRPAASSLAQTIYEALPNDTDLTTAKGSGIAGANFGFIDRLPHYHTPLDTLENISERSIQHQGDNVTALALALAGQDLTDLPQKDLVYTDLWTRAVFMMPAAWALPAAVISLLLLIAAAGFAGRGSSFHPLKGLAAFFILPVLAILSGIGGMAVYEGARLLTPEPGFATPWLLTAALIIALWGMTVLVSASLGRWAGTKLSLFVPWLMLGIIASLLAWKFPGASIVLILPVGFASLCLLVFAIVSRGSHGLLAVGAAVSAIVGLAFLAPMTVTNTSALGGDMHFAMTVPLSLMLAGFVPVIGTARPGWPAVIVAITLLVSSTMTLGFTPSYSAFRPKPQNINYVADYRVGHAQWRIATAGDLNQAFRDTAAFSEEPEPAIAALASRAYAAEADMALAPPRPVITLEDLDPAVRYVMPLPVSDDSAGANRTVSIKIGDIEDAWRVRLLIPEAAMPTGIFVDDHGISLTGKEALDGYHVLDCYTGACDNIIVELGSAEAAEWVVAAVYSGLPASDTGPGAARPAWMTPIHDGDTRTVITSAHF